MTTIAKFESDFKNNILGYSAMGIIVSTCLGGIAIMQILSFGNGFLQMVLVMLSVMICSAHNAAILTVQPPKVIYKLLVSSVIINVLLIVGSFLF